MKRLYNAARIASNGRIGTQAALARTLNTSSQRIKNWEMRGISHVGANQAQATLGISSTYILEGTEPKFLSEVATFPELPPSPSDYVRFELLDSAAGMGPGRIHDDFPEVTREIKMAVWEVRRKLGFVPKPGRVRIITGRGDSMTPDIQDGDLLMVDTARDHYDGEGVYIIGLDGHIQAKRLQLRPDGLHVLSDNARYPPWHVPHEQVPDLTIGGRVLGVYSLKAL